MNTSWFAPRVKLAIVLTRQQSSHDDQIFNESIWRNMALIGVLCAVHPRSDLPAHPKAGLQAGGISLLMRGLRQLQTLGATKALVLIEKEGGLIQPALPSKWRGMDIIPVIRAIDLVTRLDDADEIIMIEEGVLVDARLVSHARMHPARQAMMVWEATSKNGVRASRIDPTYSFASVLKTSGNMVRTIAKGLGDWDMEQTLIRQVAAQVDTALVVANDINTYDATALHAVPLHAVPLLWQPVSSAADEEVIADDLIASLHKTGQDWSTTFIHAPFEKFVMKGLLKQNFNMDYCAGAILGLGIISVCLVAVGWPRLALVLAIGFGMVTGIQQTIARLRIQIINWHKGFEIAVNIIAVSWCLALAYYVAKNSGTTTSWAIAVIIIIVSTSKGFLDKIFKELTGNRLSVFSPLDRQMKLFEGTCTVYLWCLIPFAIGAFWYWGIIFVAIYATLTFFWAQFRFLVNFREFLRVQSEK